MHHKKEVPAWSTRLLLLATFGLGGIVGYWPGWGRDVPLTCWSHNRAQDEQDIETSEGTESTLPITDDNTVDTPAPHAWEPVVVAKTDAETMVSVTGQDDMLSLLEQLFRSPETDQAKVDATFQRLVSQVSQSATERSRLVSRFTEVAGTAFGDFISSAFAGLDDFEVEARLADLLHTASTPSRQLAAVAALSELHESATIRSVLLDFLSTSANADPAVVTATIETVGRHTEITEQSEQQRIIERLSPLLAATEPSVRAAALEALTVWAPGETVTRDALQLAVDDRDPNVKAKALLLLAGGRFAGDAVKNLLITTLADQTEPSAVRSAAAEGLQAHYAVDDFTYQLYSEYKNVLPSLPH